jgi:hypothetical protein
MLADIYCVPAEQVASIAWKGSSDLYDYELSKLGKHHSRFCVVNAEFANTNITDLITNIPYTGRCVVWYKDSTWAVKLFNQGWQREFGYTNLEFTIPRLDVIFISYNEPDAEQNWQRVLEKAPYAKRVNGVKGIFEAHQAAARLAKSDMFYVVDGDAYLENSWTFDFQPTLYDRDCAYIWNSRNPINNLVYGYGGVKLFPRKQILAIKEWTKLDFATTAVGKLKVINEISNVTAFNTDEFNTWRSAFRECVKLSSSDNEESKARLDIWCLVGSNNPYSEYAISGARYGKEYGTRYKNNSSALTMINNYSWVAQQFKDNT